MQLKLDTNSMGRKVLTDKSLSRTDTVLDLKKSIQKHLMIDSKTVRLFFGGKQLVDDVSLFDYQINNSSTVTVFAKSMVPIVPTSSETKAASSSTKAAGPSATPPAVRASTRASTSANAASSSSQRLTRNSGGRLRPAPSTPSTSSTSSTSSTRASRSAAWSKPTPTKTPSREEEDGASPPMMEISDDEESRGAVRTGQRKRSLEEDSDEAEYLPHGGNRSSSTGENDGQPRDTRRNRRTMDGQTQKVEEGEAKTVESITATLKDPNYGKEKLDKSKIPFSIYEYGTDWKYSVQDYFHEQERLPRSLRGPLPAGEEVLLRDRKLWFYKKAVVLSYLGLQDDPYIKNVRTFMYNVKFVESGEVVENVTDWEVRDSSFMWGSELTMHGYHAANRNYSTRTMIDLFDDGKEELYEVVLTRVRVIKRSGRYVCRGYARVVLDEAGTKFSKEIRLKQYKPLDWQCMPYTRLPECGFEDENFELSDHEDELDCVGRPPWKVIDEKKAEMEAERKRKLEAKYAAEDRARKERNRRKIEAMKAQVGDEAEWAEIERKADEVVAKRLKDREARERQLEEDECVHHHLRRVAEAKAKAEAEAEAAGLVPPKKEENSDDDDYSEEEEEYEEEDDKEDVKEEKPEVKIEPEVKIKPEVKVEPEVKIDPETIAAAKLVEETEGKLDDEAAGDEDEAAKCGTCKGSKRVRLCPECGCSECQLKDDEVRLFCDECNYATHLNCLGLTQVPEGDWYCKECKNDPSEIVSAGQAPKQTKKVKAAKGNKVKPGKRKWDSGMATAARQKVCKKVPTDHIGKIPGILVGSSWRFRMGVSESGVHRPPVAGIHATNREAYSIVMSGGYEGSKDDGDTFTYAGSGGRNLDGNARTAGQSSHQELTKSNLGLALSCAAPFSDKGAVAKDWKKSKPIRVIRSCKAKKVSDFAPDEGNRYDGIYKISRYYQLPGQSGFKMWIFEFKRDDTEPAPWTTEGKKYIKKHALTMEWPENHPEHPDVLEANGMPVPKKLKPCPYNVKSDVVAAMRKDKINKKYWDVIINTASEGIKAFYDCVEETFLCSICTNILKEPTTLPCCHSFCMNCMGKVMKASEETVCPNCRFAYEKSEVKVNQNLKNALQKVWSADL